MRFLSRLVACIGIAGLTISPAQGEVKFSGLLEVEINSLETFTGVKSSDIVLARLELGMDASVSDRVSIHVLTLHEDGETEPMEVDEATITFVRSGKSYIKAGRMYVPFGVFETNMISDPLTLELAETRETVLQFGYFGEAYGSFYVFNGDTIESGVEDKIEHYGFNFGIIRNLPSERINAGIGYISSLGDSDVVSNFLTGGSGGSATVTEYVGGASIYYNYVSGSFNFFIEYIEATDAFDAARFGFNGANAEPNAINIEIGQSSGNTTWAFAVQETEQALALGLPESRKMLSYTNQIAKATTFSIEFIKETDYAVGTSGGTGVGTGATVRTITLQLAAKF